MSQKMKPIDETKETVTFRSVSKDEAGMKRVEKAEVETHNIDTLKHVEKKLIDKGVHRLDRRPRDGMPLEKTPKSGRGGKFTWEGPAAREEMGDCPAAMDEGDPNYVDEEAEEKVVRGAEAEGLVVGEVEVAKVAGEGVARIDVNPKLNIV